VVGSKGTVSIDGDSVVLGDDRGVRAFPVPDDLVLAPMEESDDPRHQFTHLELGPYTRLCEALHARIEGRPITNEVPLPTFADGVACMRVLDAIRESAAREGATIRLARHR
jgi:predicted dehydrogenase